MKARDQSKFKNTSSNSQMVEGREKFKDELIKTAREIATPGKGILAADESTATIGLRFDAIKVENTEANRQAYR